MNLSRLFAVLLVVLVHAGHAWAEPIPSGPIQRSAIAIARSSPIEVEKVQPYRTKGKRGDGVFVLVGAAIGAGLGYVTASGIEGDPRWKIVLPMTAGAAFVGAAIGYKISN